MEIVEIVAALAGGYVIRTEIDEHDREYFLDPPGARRLVAEQVSRLIREGWLESFNGGYRLSDDGKKAYLRSTDELGNGKLVAPFASEGCVRSLPSEGTGNG